MCYFVKLVFSGKRINELNLNLSLENTFLKVRLFKITDYPPHCRDSALGPGQARSLGWLREVCAAPGFPLAVSRLSPGVPTWWSPQYPVLTVNSCPMARALHSHWDFPAQTPWFSLAQAVILELYPLELHGVDFCPEDAKKPPLPPRNVVSVQLWLQ